MTIRAILFLFAVLAAGSACSKPAPNSQSVPTAGESPAAAPTEVPQLSVNEVETLLGKPGVFVFDGNLELYYQKGHLPGAKLAFYDDISADLLPPDKSATLIFYCKNPQCQTAEMSAKRALALGYTKVYRMPAGIDGWIKAGKPVVREKA